MVFNSVQISKAQIKAARGSQLPMVNANASFWQRKFGYYTMDDAGNRVTEFAPGDTIPNHLPDYFVGLTTTWELDIWGKLRNMRKSALAQYLASIEGTNFVISNLVAKIATNYYELIALDNKLDILNKTIEKQKEALFVVKMLKDAGRTNELAVQQFTAQLLQWQTLQKDIRQEIIEKENEINFLMGRFPQKVDRTMLNVYINNNQTFKSGIPSQLLQNRPDIREAELKVKASKFDLKTAKAAFFPNINITFGLGYQAYNPKFLLLTPTSIMYSALGGLITPIVNRNGIKAQFNSAKAYQLDAMYNYQKTVLNAYTEVLNQLSNLKNLEEINTIKKQQTDILYKSIETSVELFKTSKATYLEVLLAQQISLQAQFEFIDINKRQFVARVNIYKALGGGWK